MSKLDYDTLYGIGIHAYCEAHNTTVETLLLKVEKDIEIINDNYRTYSNRTATLTDEELETVVKIIKVREKKRNHLKHLKQYIKGK